MAGKITKQELNSTLSTEIEGKANTSTMNTELAKKANTSHTHTISNVTNLQTELDKMEQVKFRVIKKQKDYEGVFTVVEYRRKNDDTLAVKSVLSEGVSPTYYKRTVTFYDKNGTTILKTEIYHLSYDLDGDLISEV